MQLGGGEDAKLAFLSAYCNNPAGFLLKIFIGLNLILIFLFSSPKLSIQPQNFPSEFPGIMRKRNYKLQWDMGFFYSLRMLAKKISWTNVILLRNLITSLKIDSQYSSQIFALTSLPNM
jgi:hypothetical protein